MVAMMPLHATTARLERSTMIPTLKKSGRPRDARGRFIRHHERLPVSLADTRGALFVVSEMADFIKAGGLGDVAAALPRALRHRYDVRVLIPGYRAVLARAGKVEIVGRVLAHAALPACDIGRIVQSDGLPIYILLSKELFERDGSPYVSSSGSEFEDNAIRFATLSHAAAQIAAGHAGLGWKPRLLHLNDWPCALAAAYVRWSGGTTPCLLTIHNLAYQGLVPYSMAAALGIPAERVAELEFYGQMSFLRGGIVHADHVNTVSVSYAQQITGPAQGCGLDRLLAGRAAKGALTGIVNGIDASWDPRTDAHLDAHFSVNHWQGRQANAAQVRKAFGLRESTGPLFAVVSRLVHQKGLDLICEVAPQIVAAGGQIAVIGGGEPEIEQQVAELTRRYPGQVGAFIGFEEGLARRMFAGADFLLMPSRFEPCGLSQMYAQRFGCLPIAHATGGLIDTVDDGVTGFLFQQASVEALRRCLERAFRTFRLPSLLSAMRRAAMLRPSGWDVAGKKYLSLYERTAATAPALATVS
ncbi:glycogen synthase GlgA [Xanthomonas hortorum pv. vitians]|uniref:Glycogen synthase n=1 Tax=Xanthomonas hortorum pv. vitians TaxID=83224 RepID=A0A6V7BGF4_9XANT|nr:glycogen synthase GlgA [Xanthomonas hortorum]APP86385.1 starch synthase [Xanthomonas hortorum pv. gardneri]ASW47639.1 starch synthase [Xanthomonas hortorum]MCC8493443.1 glycogen synthase GlgA [Xanthomonas hortorum pv. gardneri]MCC8556132.1 glycogen synthase GlgA [Xanthomonas hortorum pv. gardneri]MCE4299072.1 glycogen synthase GlgA [Xanthomonas hortorum pv. vitians]